MADDVDWDAEEEDNLAEQYVKLMPYILRDFVHKDDIKNMVLAILADPSGLLGEFLSESEGIRAAQEYKALLDSGEDLAKRVKPVVKF